MIHKIRRLVNLRKLISIEDRIAALETQGRDVQNRLRNHRNALNNQSNRLQKQGDKLRERIDPLQRNQIDHLRRRVRVLELKREHFEEQVDLLKSSLEVPRDLVEDFFEWKARTPIPAKPLVTVAVATYNRARLLAERCIPSVLGQTYDNLELIVVGDGCTDETEEVMAGICDPRLSFVNLPERGSYPADPMRRWMVAGTQALNKAMSMARGDFVTHLDDDDEYVPDRLEKLVEFAVENRCDFVWHPCWTEDNEGRWKLIEAPRFAYTQVTTSSVFYRSWFTKIEWNIDAHLLMEPGDWNRFRRIKYIDPVIMRYPEPLLNHYRQMNQSE